MSVTNMKRLIICAIALISFAMGMIVGSRVEKHSEAPLDNITERYYDGNLTVTNDLYRLIAPTTGTVIDLIKKEYGDGSSMYTSVIEYADKARTIEAHYYPSAPWNVVFVGTGFSSNEVEYKFFIHLTYNSVSDKTWELGFLDWEKLS